MRCVYKITNNLNGKFYIGSTTRYKKRVGQWRDYTSNVNSPVKKDILKYGRDNFSFKPMKIYPDDTPKKILAAEELRLIHELNPEYNVIGKARPETTRKKLSLALKGKTMSDEMKAKVRAGILKHNALFPQTNAGHLKDVLLIELGKTFHGVKAAAEFLEVHPSSVTKAIKRNGKVQGYHVVLLKCRD